MRMVVRTNSVVRTVMDGRNMSTTPVVIRDRHVETGGHGDSVLGLGTVRMSMVRYQNLMGYSLPIYLRRDLRIGTGYGLRFLGTIVMTTSRI